MDPRIWKVLLVIFVLISLHLLYLPSDKIDTGFAVCTSIATILLAVKVLHKD